jgi:DNA-binding NtrC family response regulator
MESIPDQNSRLLIVDDDVGLLLSLKMSLVSAGLPEPALVSDSRRVMDLIEKHQFDLVLIDLIMPHATGMELLQEIKKQYPDIECIIITAVDEVDMAVEAMRFGAYDYMVKPLETEKLMIIIDRALERHDLKQKISLLEMRSSFDNLTHPDAFGEMVAESHVMAGVFHQAEIFAVNDYNLLITGETGTGKEMLAHIVHNLSRRASGPFVAVNMGAFSRSLFEDEFFGHAKGAYTGATESRKGFFEEAQGGTLFLDEISELDWDLQKKLLRVTEEREVYRLGSSKSKSIDSRIVSSTNRDIQAEVKKGQFRNDLYYRLNVCHIHIPPLRERKKDILPLAQRFLQIHAVKNDKAIRALAPDLCENLLHYDFPGNVRELDNIVASAVVTETNDVLTLSSAGSRLPGSEPELPPVERLLPLFEVEKQYILRVLEANDGNRTQTAKALGIGLRTLQRKLKI